MQITRRSYVPVWLGAFYLATAFTLLFLLSFLSTYSACHSQIWEDFTVWYDGNGADSGHISERLYKAGSNEITLEENAASEGSSDTPYKKDGCTFLGWSLEPEKDSAIAPILPGGTVWDPVDVPVTWIENRQGFVFYARWECDPSLVSPRPTRVKPTEVPAPTAAPTAVLLIGPRDDSAPTATAVPEVTRATPTTSLLIYPDTRRKVSKDGGSLNYGETGYDAAGESFAQAGSAGAFPSGFPVLFTSENGELSALPETGITARSGLSENQMPASIDYKPTRMELQIPSLDISSMIVTVEHDENGYPIQWLGMNTGLLADTSLPGEGFSVLAAHNTLDNDTFGPFALIGALRKGDRIFINTQENTLMIFEVYTSEKINEYDYEALYRAGAMYENTVTLLTCEDERPEGGYTNRRIVSARKIN